MPHISVFLFLFFFRVFQGFSPLSLHTSIFSYPGVPTPAVKHARRHQRVLTCDCHPKQQFSDVSGGKSEVIICQGMH